MHLHLTHKDRKHDILSGVSLAHLPHMTYAVSTHHIICNNEDDVRWRSER
jgi:hypothetical protein